MAKLTLTDLANLQNENTAVSAINANNAAIETAMENTLSRDGTSPNTMGANLDMNSNRILNLIDATTDQEPATYGQLTSATGTAILASSVAFTPTGSVSATNVQTAIAEVDTEKAAISSLATIATTGASTDLVDSIGSWTPALTFVTPGDLAVAYTTQIGKYIKQGKMVMVTWNILTSSFTHTTASGFFRISGLPFTSNSTAGVNFRGSLQWSTITKANYTQFLATVGTGVTVMNVNAVGSGQASAFLTTTEITSGGTYNLVGSIIYFTD